VPGWRGTGAAGCGKSWVGGMGGPQAIRGGTISAETYLQGVDRGAMGDDVEGEAVGVGRDRGRVAAVEVEVYWLSVNETGGWVDERRG